MNTATLLTPERILCKAPANSKKKVLETVAHLIGKALPDTPARKLFNQLVDRERLGTTGLGQGVAIPHCCYTTCLAPTGALMQLANPVDFDAVDGQSVDLVFALVVPEQATQVHLDLLQALAKRFQSTGLLEKLRTANSPMELYAYMRSEEDGAEKPLP